MVSTKSTNPVVKIKYVDINLGSSGYLPEEPVSLFGKDNTPIRRPKYREDRIVNNFPLLLCLPRLKESLEFDTYLIDRFTGAFAVKENSRKDHSRAWSEGYYQNAPGKGVSVERVKSIAKRLKRFLDWLIKNNVTYEELLTVPSDINLEITERAEMPIWRYQSDIVDLVKSRDQKIRLTYNYANELLSAVRYFFLWCYARGRINSIPFNVEYELLHSPNNITSNNMFDAPVTKPKNHSAILNLVSDYGVSKADKQKEDAPQDLQPYSPLELKQLLPSKTLQTDTYATMVRTTLLGGFRPFEIVQVDYKDLSNPDKKGSPNFFRIAVKRKGHKPVRVIISSSLMRILWKYTETNEWKQRRLKHETRYGINNPEEPLPVFLNRSGNRMAETTPGNILSFVRKELGSNFERSFYDLRATFATYTASALLDAGLSDGEIKATLMMFMSHESFETTRKYLDFAKLNPPQKHGVMEEWVKDIYTKVPEVLAILEEQLRG
ncbi:site-specific integrase [Vibrio natriegens]|uniref:tyrosine-type recombinase/integrase n=1 Tax=Vibrio natriegens TaxID=691 RepID=UPI001EFE0C35|nr:site-specific integrase [Vibrio natriegens]MCG9702832.1 site-specific integrase [Vibrio natriegens]